MVRRVLVGIVLLMALSAASPPSWAAGDPACFTERVCANREAMLKAYGLQPAESLQAQGETSVRVFLLDAWFHGLPAVNFTSRGPGKPRLTVISEERPDAPRLVLQDRSVSPSSWRKVMGEVEVLRRTAPDSALSEYREVPQRDGSTEVQLCADSETLLVESISPAEILRRKRTVCLPDPAVDAMEQIGEAAIDASPGCGRLDHKAWGFPFRRLGTCYWLRGNLDAAAEVDNALMTLNLGFGLDPKDVASAFVKEGVLDWGGKQASGVEMIGALWKRELGDETVDLYTGTLIGDAQDRVRVACRLARRRTGQSDLDAPCEMVWAREPRNGLWRIRRWTVGAFKAASE